MSDGGQDVTCDYCDSPELAYELESDRGSVCRCIPCLAVEQGQQKFSMPFESFIADDDFRPIWDDLEDWNEHRRMAYEGARDWFRILARIRQDDPILKRDPDGFGTVNEHTRTFLTNVMGSAAHYPPSEIAESDGNPGQTTLGDADD